VKLAKLGFAFEQKMVGTHRRVQKKRA
jgi:hypothetical protein